MTELARIEPPDFGMPGSFPAIPAAEYEERLTAAVAAAAAAGLDVLLVYADREHSAHQEFLCGVGPRFEESILLLTADGRRTLALGNECQAYLPDPALRIETRLFQDFSPLGQQRDQGVALADLLRDAGLRAGARVGCAGWKSLTAGFVGDAACALEIPSYIADAVRNTVGDPRLAVNANHIFLQEGTGLRLTNSVRQIAQFEYASTVTSASVRNAILAVREGVTERELEGEFRSSGLPLSCHAMISFGDKVRRGLASPSDKRAATGDAFMICQGLQGALTCRGGVVSVAPRATGADFFDAFARNYFDVIATWYESVRVGAVAGEVFDAVDEVRDPRLFSFLLPPGHHLSIEEWAQSSFRPGNGTVLRSGAVLQSDIIPVAAGPFCYANAEDGIVLADEGLRQTLAASEPELWARIQARRAFMGEVIGIRLDPSVLPLGNTPAWFPPYALDAGLALVRG
jgi:hypothetical protein